MTAQDPPAVARRRVRLALRHARQRQGLTQSQVAEALEWSLSKVQRIESGDVSVSTTDLRAALALLDVRDPRRVDQLVEDAKASRRQRWWTRPEYRDHLTPAMLQLLQFESEATAIRVFQATLVPGILQTADYAGWIQRFWSRAVPEEDMKVRVELRARRREGLFGAPDPPRYLLVLDESVLHRDIGGPSIFADQLEFLLDLIRRQAISVRIVPFPEGAIPAMLGSFTILELGDEEDVFLYRESGWQTDSFGHSIKDIRRWREIYEQVWGRSFAPDISARLIEARMAELRALIGRSRARLADPGPGTGDSPW
ncbi:helix-turn-helix domain-containing protein [Catenuloplanes japonicus]|uniref:helix-turn-helix domain-containing protein n=1 Tax=Catenuloplanes japonicus TaxID=33876 RepID=UPI00068DD1AB|nr:helix-turn-helix transcriptional regulator [Catenuloplanes japonicus]